MRATRQQVYEAIDSERAYQVSRAESVSGAGTGEHEHSVEEYLIYMEDYLTELRHQVARTWTPSGNAAENVTVLDTLRKVTALGVACMEQHGAPRRGGF